MVSGKQRRRDLDRRPYLIFGCAFQAAETLFQTEFPLNIGFWG
jgi:hypothetical protein